MLKINSLIFFSLFSSWQTALSNPVSINVVVDIDTSNAATVHSNHHHNDAHAIDGPRFTLSPVDLSGSGPSLYVDYSRLPIFPPRLALSTSPAIFRLDLDSDGDLFIGDTPVSVGPDGMLVQIEDNSDRKVTWRIIRFPRVNGPVLAPIRNGNTFPPILFTDRLSPDGQIYACISGVDDSCQDGKTPILLKLTLMGGGVVSEDFTKGFDAQKALEL